MKVVDLTHGLHNGHRKGERQHASPLVLLPETPLCGIFTEKPTVVNRPDFYYHLTTVDGIDLPHFAVFCFFRTHFCLAVHFRLLCNTYFFSKSPHNNSRGMNPNRISHIIDKPED